jgi:hypothetical protein
LSCAQKLVIAAAIQNAEETGTGSFDYQLGLDSAPLATGSGDPFTSRLVADAISIVITQSAIRLTYPVTYLQDANNGMTEVLLSADSRGTALDAVINPCRDEHASSTAATCGWALKTEASGAQSAVPNSQGFCCSCSADLTSLTLTSLPRSGQTCTFFQRPAAASCPRLSRLWHSIYAIGEPSMDFDIRLYIYRCRPTDVALAAWSNASGTAAAYAAPRCRTTSPGCTCELLQTDSVNRQQGLPNLGPSLPVKCYPLPGRPLTSCDLLFKLIGTFQAPSATVVGVGAHCQSESGCRRYELGHLTTSSLAVLRFQAASGAHLLRHHGRHQRRGRCHVRPAANTGRAGQVYGRRPVSGVPGWHGM